MKAFKTLTLIGCLVAAFATSCTTEPAPELQADKTSQTAQQVGGGDDLCSGWASCYAFCRRLYSCTNPTKCALQENCLNNCDASWQPAPEFCPYPDGFAGSSN